MGRHGGWSGREPSRLTQGTEQSWHRGRAGSKAHSQVGCQGSAGSLQVPSSTSLGPIEQGPAEDRVSGVSFPLLDPSSCCSRPVCSLSCGKLCWGIYHLQTEETNARQPRATKPGEEKAPSLESRGDIWSGQVEEGKDSSPMQEEDSHGQGAARA